MTRKKRTSIGGWAALKTTVLVWVMLSAGPVSAESESQLKAAFIYNFSKYVAWPQELEQAGGDLRVCVLGRPPSKAIWSLQGRPVRAFHLLVVELDRAADLSRCHILYINSRTKFAVLAKLNELPLLTIGDQHGFLTQGGVIELYQDKRHLRFDVNLKQAKQAGLQISAKLLQLAGRVLK